MPKEFRPLFRTGKVNARVRKKGNGYEVRCQVDGERISVYGKLLYEAKAKFIVKLAELRSPSRPRKRNSVLLDKKLYISGKTRHSRTVKRNFSTFREENSRPLRGHKENSRINICDCFLYPFGWQRADNTLIPSSFSISLYIMLSRRFLTKRSNIYTIMYLNAPLFASEIIL